MVDSEAQRQAIASLLDVVEELAVQFAGQSDAMEWANAVVAAFKEHRHELREAIPDRLLGACGGDVDAARAVVRLATKDPR